MTKDELEAEDALRLRYLREVYENTSNGLVNSYVYDNALDHKLGLDVLRGRLLRQYLEGEGLIQSRGQGVVSMTHRGNVEVEQAIRGKATEHFPIAVVNVLQNVSNSNVQVSSPGAIQTVQTQALDPSTFMDLRKAIDEMRGRLDDLGLTPEAKGQLVNDLGSASTQLERQPPKKSVLRALLESVLETLTKTATDQATNTLVPMFIDQVKRLLPHL
jgi:hypothetical protein